jgi:hypothetical protein
MRALHRVGVFNASVGELYSAVALSREVEMLPLQGSTPVNANFFYAILL